MKLKNAFFYLTFFTVLFANVSADGSDYHCPQITNEAKCPSLPVYSSGFEVSTAADSGTGSLREIIACATSGSTITFSAALNGIPIQLTSGNILIEKKTLIIQGNGKDSTIIDGALDSFSRIFYVRDSADVIMNNLTIQNGGSNLFYNACAGIVVWDNSILQLKSCCLKNNISKEVGGALLISESIGVMEDCIFEGNSGSSGGVCFVQLDANVSMTNTILKENRAFSRGAGIYVWNGSLSVDQSVFYKNEVSEHPYGQAVCLYAGNFSSNSNTDISVRNCTFTKNIYGSNDYVIYIGSSTNVNCSNNIIHSNNGLRSFAGIFSGLDAFNNLLDTVPGINVGTNGNFIGNPSFTNAATNDFSLTNNSQAIEAGSNDEMPIGLTLDLNGNNRIVGCNIDVGAFENQSSPSVLTVLNSNDDGPWSFRQAVDTANTGDTIRFCSIINNNPIKLQTPVLLQNKSLILVGNGKSKTIFDGGSVNNLFLIDSNAHVDFHNMRFQNAIGPIIKTYKSSSIANLTNCTIVASEGTYCMRLKAGESTLLNCSIEDNSAVIASFQIDSFSNLAIQQCVFSNNLSPVLINGFDMTKVKVSQSTFVNNIGIVCQNVDSLIFINNIFRNNGIAALNNSTLISSNNIINNPGQVPIDTLNNIEKDPLFMDELNGDFQLQACSPAINSGLNDGNLPKRDFIDNERIKGWTVDRGAFESFEQPCLLGLCDYPIDIISGIPYHGTTAQSDNFMEGYSCTSINATGPDIIHMFGVPFAGDITITLDDLSEEGEQNLDAILLNSCLPDSCIAFVPDTLVIFVPVGQYVIVVDGRNGTEGPSFGNYRLLVECPSTPEPCTQSLVYINQPISPAGFYYAIDSIQSDAIIVNPYVEFKAGTLIDLSGEFEVTLGSEFEANTLPCPSMIDDLEEN